MFYIGELHEQGLMSVTHTVRFNTNKDPEVYLNQAAATFLDKQGSIEKEGAYLFANNRSLRVGMVREVSAEQYQQMESWQSVTTV